MDADKKNGGTRLLVVEDHPVVRQGVSAVLSQQRGVEVSGQAADGEEALRLVEELHPDVILTDVDLPGLSGLDVAERLSQNHGNRKSHAADRS
jgi:DNA-binding NarL/FixJ family response regulator